MLARAPHAQPDPRGQRVGAQGARGSRPGACRIPGQAAQAPRRASLARIALCIAMCAARLIAALGVLANVGRNPLCRRRKALQRSGCGGARLRRDMSAWLAGRRCVWRSRGCGGGAPRQSCCRPAILYKIGRHPPSFGSLRALSALSARTAPAWRGGGAGVWNHLRGTLWAKGQAGRRSDSCTCRDAPCAAVPVGPAMSNVAPERAAAARRAERPAAGLVLGAGATLSGAHTPPQAVADRRGPAAPRWCTTTG